MSVSQKDLEDLLLATQRANRESAPPAAMAGIGQFQSALCPAVFGGLSLIGPATDQPLGTTPEKLVGFDAVMPASGGLLTFEGMLPSETTDDLIVLDRGIYLVLASINAVVSTGAA